MRRPAKKNEKCCAGFGSQLCQTAIKNTPQQEIHCGVSLSICAMPIKAIPHNSKCRYGERGAADAKPKAQIILDAAKVSAASGGNSEPKQGQRSQGARGFCPRSTMRVPQPDIIEHFGNADAVPQLPERCLSRKAGIVRYCLGVLLFGVTAVLWQRTLSPAWPPFRKAAAARSGWGWTSSR